MKKNIAIKPMLNEVGGAVKKGIKNGYVVKMKDGRIGMVTWKKDNNNIGINFVNYHQITKFMGIDRTIKEQRDWIMKLGADDVFTKYEIIEIIRDNEIYK